MTVCIAVLGAGTMGSGIAELFAAHGFAVALYDPDGTVLHNVRQRLSERGISFAAAEGKPAAYGDTAKHAFGTGSVRLTSELANAVCGAGFVIEAGPEKLETKRELLHAIAPFLADDAIVASNTSTLPLESLAQGQTFANRLLIAHFFNPATVVPLVEVVGLPDTEPGVVERAAALMVSCGKAPVVLKKDCPGFIANRLQAAVLREACHLLSCGVADAEQIDRAMTEGPGLRWALNGPFAIADYGGLDIWEKVTGNLFPLLGGDREAPEVISASVRQNRLGFKSGAGFYEYGDGEARQREASRREQALRQLIRGRKGESES